MNVYKYAIPMADSFSLHMPKSAEIIHVAVQDNKPYMWARVNPNNEPELRVFRLAGTGHTLAANVTKHLGSFMLHDESLVFHLFEKE